MTLGLPFLRVRLETVKSSFSKRMLIPKRYFSVFWMHIFFFLSKTPPPC